VEVLLLKHLFIFDEPTTGLHFHDVAKLLKSFNALIERGHSIIVIEHNLDVIKCADWMIDIGPEGGEEGGTVVAQGTPEDVAKSKVSYTAKYLKEKL
jgi:excinuclease ABC subunit A